MPPIKEVVVVGCGVSGLTCGIKLLAHFPVKIISHQLSPNTTSDVAGAYFTPYPYLEDDETFEERIPVWTKTSMAEFLSLSQIPGTGVSIKTFLDLFKDKTDLPWWKDIVSNFRMASSAELLEGFRGGYVMELPKIETPIYMPYLIKRFLDAGGQIEQCSQPIKFLADLVADQRLIINCTGLGSYQLCSDKEVYPIRGQIVCVEGNRVNKFLRYAGESVLVVPRENDCVLGSTGEINDWNQEVDLKVADDIFQRCRKLVPELNDAKIIGHKVGLRPARNKIRLEIELVDGRSAVIHNYGHGKSGITFSWGCAQEVVELARSFAGK